MKSAGWTVVSTVGRFTVQKGLWHLMQAAAMAVRKNPKLLLCDEPTGALDYNTGKQILQLLQDTCRKENITVLLITHNSALAPMADRLIRFKSGKVIEITKNEHPTDIAEIEW